MLALLMIAALGAPIQTSFHGTWGGWVKVGNDRFWLQVRAQDGGLLIDDINVRQFGRRPSEFSVKDGQVRFKYDAREGMLAFSGNVSERRFAGEVRIGSDTRGKFEFTRFAEIPPEQFERHLGLYETDQGNRLWVVPRTCGGVRIVRYKGEGRRLGDYSFEAWLPWKDNAYFEAVVEGTALPPRRSLVFDGDRLEIHGDGGYAARRVPDASVKLMTFRSGSLTLHGWLMSPPSKTPRPAIAYTHGSGYIAADHIFDLYHTVRMARHLGVAVLRWDKRGVWHSGGDAEAASYHDLADDVSAAVAWLREQKGIDPEKVGIGGISQAPSAPLPIAAARCDAVAFVIATSGFVGTILEANLFSWSNKMRKEGHPEKDIQEMREFFEELNPYVLDSTPAGQKAYDAFLDQFRDKPWYSRADSLALLQTPLDDPALEQWRNIHDVDSAEYWRRVRCPVFQTWGADDHLVNVKQSASRMAELVAASGQKNFTSIVYPSPGGHGVGTANTPTYFDDLARWFRNEVGVR